MELFCGNNLRVKAVGCFGKGAPSLMFDRIMNWTPSEENVSIAGVTQGNLELLLRPNSPDSPKHKYKKMKSRTDKAKNV